MDLSARQSWGQERLSGAFERIRSISKLSVMRSASETTQATKDAMISTKTNRKPLAADRLAAYASPRRNWQSPEPVDPMEHGAGATLRCLTGARAAPQLVRYRVMLVERTTNGELVAMERYAAQDPMSAVERARQLAAEAAGGIAFLLLDRDSVSPPVKEIIAAFGLEAEEARRILRMF